MLQEEFRTLRDHIEALNSPKVFCHNDLLHLNIIYNKDKGIPCVMILSLLLFILYTLRTNVPLHEISKKVSKEANIRNRYNQERSVKTVLLDGLNYFHSANLVLNSYVDQNTFKKVTKQHKKTQHTRQPRGQPFPSR